MQHRHQQKKTQYSTYESRENLDSFSFSVLSEISQTENAQLSTIKQHFQCSELLYSDIHSFALF